MLKWNDKILFYIRLGGLILITFFLVTDLILAITHPQPQFEDLNYSERVSNYYSFFTTQTNYIVAIYFFAYLFENKFKHKKPSYLIKLAVTTYITVTMLVFWFGIITKAQASNQYDAYHWVSTVILHLIIPSSMITSYVLTSGDIIYHLKTHHKLYLWLILLYPFLYFLIISVRGSLRYYSGRPAGTWYPYFFLNVHQHLGWLIMIFSILLIIGLFVGLQYLYIYINNLLYIKYKGQTLNKTVNEKIFGIKENSGSNPSSIISFEPEIAEEDDSGFFSPPSNPENEY